MNKIRPILVKLVCLTNKWRKLLTKMHTKYSLFSSFFPLLFIFENLFVLFTSCVAHPTKKLHMEKVFGNGNIYHKRYKLMPSNLICPYETFLHEYYHRHSVMNNFMFLIFTFKQLD